MPNYYNEKAIIMPFLAKYSDDFSMQEQITSLINALDETTLKFILDLNPQEQGIEDFQTVARFIKENQTAIITQLNDQNLFYSRLNFAFVLPAFITFVSAIPIMVAIGWAPVLALGVASLAGLAMITALAGCSGLIYDNLEKKHLYEEVAQKSMHRTNNNCFYNKELFRPIKTAMNNCNNELVLPFETMNNLCNLPKIFGMTS